VRAWPRNFTLDEMQFSDVAVRYAIDNRADDRQAELLRCGAIVCLQPARDRFGRLRTTSGYRAPEVNRIVGGSTASDHMIAKRLCAYDIVPLEAPLIDVFEWMVDNRDALHWAKLIWEYGVWLHVSYHETGATVQRRPRQAISSIGRSGERHTTYPEIQNMESFVRSVREA